MADSRKQLIAMLERARERSQLYLDGPWLAAWELANELDVWLLATAPEEEEEMPANRSCVTTTRYEYDPTDGVLTTGEVSADA